MLCSCYMIKAFSLVELSIVLVILGLLTGSILAGQSLIRAAELRSLSIDLTKYNTAVRTFQDKYIGLPGDMPNATRFWGIAGGTTGNDAACYAVATTSTPTCNGNGDGWIETFLYNGSDRLLAWKHLANAGLVEGSYTGRDGAPTQGDWNSPSFYIPGTNVPRARIGDSAYHLLGLTSAIPAGNPQYFEGPYGFNVIGLTRSVLRPEEAWNIDVKMDDGRPGLGRVFGYKASSTWEPGCTTTDAPGTSEWAVSNSSVRCTLHQRIQ